MCGITGIVYSDPDRYVDSDCIDEMSLVIHHRGPDEWGKWVNRYVGIGMTRLRIIDLAKGSQPIHNEDKSIWIVFNGEIYNFQDLRKDLKKEGILFIHIQIQRPLFICTKSWAKAVFTNFEECFHLTSGMKNPTAMKKAKSG